MPYRPLQASTGPYRPHQYPYRPLQASTGLYRPLQASTGLFRPYTCQLGQIDSNGSLPNCVRHTAE